LTLALAAGDLTCGPTDGFVSPDCALNGCLLTLFVRVRRTASRSSRALHKHGVELVSKVDGSLVFYLDGPKWRHAGLGQADGSILSKWASSRFSSSHRSGARLLRQLRSVLVSVRRS
jgi:hypothetical protein